LDRWRSFLRRFPDGESKFPWWTFWPSTVFTADAARDLLHLFKTDKQLQDLLRDTRIWASEEIIFPTLTSLLGYQVAQHPCSYDYVKYRQEYTQTDVEQALGRPVVFWMHPIPRRYGNGLRRRIRSYHRHYSHASRSSPAELINKPNSALPFESILNRMKTIEGWLEEEEAELLISACTRIIADSSGAHAIVEIGSYCGRGTVVLGSMLKKSRAPHCHLYAVDPHEGKQGALDYGLHTVPPSLEKLQANLSSAGLSGWVSILPRRAWEIPWQQPVHLLVVDGLHDYPNAARDFYHYEPWIVLGGYVAFHDYADYFPGVQALVSQIIADGNFCKVALAGSMIVLQKLSKDHWNGET
jgi:hypothetical protein